WTAERDRFLAAFSRIEGLSDAPRRTQDRNVEADGARSTSLVRAADAPFINEPDTDWTSAANRARIAGTALDWATRALEYVPLQIDGHVTPGARQAERIDPSRPGKTAYRHALGDRGDVDRALAAALRAQPAWAARGADKHGARLEACAVELGRRRGELIGAMMIDGAKTVTEADAEVSEAIDFARYYGRALRDIADETRDCDIDPLGVVVVPPPWNFPLSIPAGGVLAALAAGNAVVLKPAPEAVLVGWELATCLWNAGIPRRILQSRPCPDDEVGRGLITDSRVDGVILTGSVETARLFLGWRPDLPLFAET